MRKRQLLVFFFSNYGLYIKYVCRTTELSRCKEMLESAFSRFLTWSKDGYSLRSTPYAFPRNPGVAGAGNREEGWALGRKSEVNSGLSPGCLFLNPVYALVLVLLLWLIIITSTTIIPWTQFCQLGREPIRIARKLGFCSLILGTAREVTRYRLAIGTRCPMLHSVPDRTVYNIIIINN